MPAPFSKSELAARIASEIAPNGVGGITAAEMRDLLIDFVNSIFPYAAAGGADAATAAAQAALGYASAAQTSAASAATNGAAAGATAGSSAGATSGASAGATAGTTAAQSVVTGLAIPSNLDNLLPNVNWQLCSGLTYIGKQSENGIGSYPAVNMTHNGTQTSGPTLTTIGGAAHPFSVGDIVILSQSGAFNFWGYAGTGYVNTLCGARVINVTPTTISIAGNFGGVAPAIAGTWAVQGICVGDIFGNTQAADGWSKSGPLDMWPDDFASNACPGAIRVLGVRKRDAGGLALKWTCPPGQLRRFWGKTISFGLLVRQKIQVGAGTWRAYIHDSITTVSYSVNGFGKNYADATYGGFEFVSVTQQVAAGCSSLEIGVEFNGLLSDVYYVALPTLVFSDAIKRSQCKQNLYDKIPATAHWNPPMLLGYQFNFPSSSEPVPGSQLYGFNNIDIEAISLCQCHRSVQALSAKVEWRTNTVGSQIYAANSINVGGISPYTQSLKFGPQAITTVAGVDNISVGEIPLYQNGTFSLFVASAAGGGSSPAILAQTWDFWDVTGSQPFSSN